MGPIMYMGVLISTLSPPFTLQVDVQVLSHQLWVPPRTAAKLPGERIRPDIARRPSFMNMWMLGLNADVRGVPRKSLTDLEPCVKYIHLVYVVRSLSSTQCLWITRFLVCKWCTPAATIAVIHADNMKALFLRMLPQRSHHLYDRAGTLRVCLGLTNSQRLSCIFSTVPVLAGAAAAGTLPCMRTLTFSIASG